MKVHRKHYGLSYAAKRMTRCYFRYLSIRKIVNVARAYLSMLFRSTRVRSLPFALKIESCSACNLRCLGCRSCSSCKLLCSGRRSGPYSGSYPSGHLRLEDLKRLLDEVASTTLGISFYLWGEPMINKQACELVAEVHRRRIATIISTNLHFLDRETSERLVKAGLDLAVVAIDGLTQQTYEKVRIGGNLETVMANLGHLLEARRRFGRRRQPLIEWQYVVTDSSQSEMEEAKRIAKSLGVDTFTPITDWCQRAAHEGEEDARRRREQRPNPACMWLWIATAIQWDGEVFPCCHVARGVESAFGNCFKEGFRTVWNNEMYRAARKKFRDGADASEGATVCHPCRTRVGTW